MTKKAADKILAGLNEALEYAKAERLLNELADDIAIGVDLGIGNVNVITKVTFVDGKAVVTRISEEEFYIPAEEARR